MKKQLTAWLLALVMLFSLVGCGADAPVQDDSSLPQQERFARGVTTPRLGKRRNAASGRESEPLSRKWHDRRDWASRVDRDATTV